MTDNGWQIAGWLLFLVSAVAFIVASLLSGDPAGLVGGVFFLLACLAFLVPHIKGR